MLHSARDTQVGDKDLSLSQRELLLHLTTDRDEARPSADVLEPVEYPSIRSSVTYFSCVVPFPAVPSTNEHFGD